MRLEHAYGRLAWLMTITGMARSISYIEVANANLTVIMGWGFRMKARLEQIESAELLEGPIPWSLGIGVHGWAGEWAANATRRPHVVIKFKSRQRARVCGFPVRVRVLHLCPEEPERLLGALQPR